MSEPTPEPPGPPSTSAPPPASPAQRTHPATPLVRAWLALIGAAAWALGTLRRDGSPTEIGIGLVVVVLGGLLLGYVAWAVTRYVIDGTELRVDGGLLVRRTRRMPYDRIQAVQIEQPLGARVFGLAQLTIEMAGGDESASRLQFLRRREAEDLRDLLLRRAGVAGAPATEATDVPGTVTDPAAPRPAPDTLVATVGVPRLVASLLLSLDVAALLLLLLLVAAGTLARGAVGGDLGGVLAVGLPLVLAAVGSLVTVVRRRGTDQWGFRLTRTDRGLRIERGLFDRTSRTVPYARVQAVAVERPLGWRPTGWCRLEVDVAGQGGDEGQDASASVLLPVGTPATARVVLDDLLDGADPAHVATTAPPRRAAWFAPVGRRWRGLGADERLLVVDEGWLLARRTVVPHAKTQSVRLRQGPLQRLLGLATLTVDTAAGPLEAEARDRDVAEARDVLVAQTARARRPQPPETASASS